jgi:hypothetical protein
LTLIDFEAGPNGEGSATRTQLVYQRGLRRGKPAAARIGLNHR